MMNLKSELRYLLIDIVGSQQTDLNIVLQLLLLKIHFLRNYEKYLGIRTVIVS